VGERSLFCGLWVAPTEYYEAQRSLLQSKELSLDSLRLLSNAQHYMVGRFYSRVEAENHKRFLGKWMPVAEFEVVFDTDTLN
jgi:hypothetical protein